LWKHPLHRVDIGTVGDLGRAVAAGYLSVNTQWRTPDTDIALILADKSDAYDAHVFLIYSGLDAVQMDASQADLDML
jgi:hypothetical protein